MVISYNLGVTRTFNSDVNNVVKAINYVLLYSLDVDNFSLMDLRIITTTTINLDLELCTSNCIIFRK